MIRQARRVAKPLLASLLAVAACSSDDRQPSETGVMVRVDAQSGTKEGLAQVRVRLFRQSGSDWEKVGDELFARDDIQWPIEIPVLPEGDLARVFEAQAQALDGDGTSISETRAVSTFIEHQQSALPLLLEDDCPSEFCDDLDSCHGEGCEVCRGSSCAPVGILTPVQLNPDNEVADQLTEILGPPPQVTDGNGDGDGDGSCSEGAECDDGVDCTAEDVCTGGICAGTPDDARCDDDNRCTDNVCDPTGGCVHPNNEASCDDGASCTDGDACLNGTCRGSDDCGASTFCDIAMDLCRACERNDECDDGNSCTDDRCVSGSCTHDGNNLGCDDGDPCTHDDMCTDGGQCSGTAVVCDDDGGTCGASRDCNGTDTCTVSYPDNAVSCNDGELCTFGDSCDGSGGCVGTPIVCDDAAGACGANRSCNGTASCTISYPDGSTSCDDGVACTHSDKCDGAGGCTGTTISCEDAAGTCGANRSCNGTPSCSVSYPNQATLCEDGDACTDGDACNGNGGCTGGEKYCWYDAVTGIYWQDPPQGNTATQNAAATFCANLDLGGHGDWVLPDVDELISLIRGSDYANCSIDYPACHGWTAQCLMGCPGPSASYGGPGPGGCYTPAALEGNCSFYWSRTADALDSADGWEIDFRDASYGAPDDGELDSVRCMRR